MPIVVTKAYVHEKRPAHKRLLNGIHYDSVRSDLVLEKVNRGNHISNQLRTCPTFSLTHYSQFVEEIPLVAPFACYGDSRCCK